MVLKKGNGIAAICIFCHWRFWYNWTLDHSLWHNTKYQIINLSIMCSFGLNSCWASSLNRPSKFCNTIYLLMTNYWSPTLVSVAFKLVLFKPQRLMSPAIPVYSLPMILLLLILTSFEAPRESKVRIVLKLDFFLKFFNKNNNRFPNNLWVMKNLGSQFE